MLAEIGLVLITGSWIVQVYEMMKSGVKGFDMKFVYVYSIGSFFLVMDSMISGRVFMGLLYLVAAVFALLAGMFTLKR